MEVQIENYKIDDKYIRQSLESFYNLIDDKEEGAADTRYKSWEWCYSAFCEGREKYKKADEDEKKKIVDYLALHLAFYLASWGMYRGSSFLLQRDYKTHIPAVKILLAEKYDSLVGYVPSDHNLDNDVNLIFEKCNGLYDIISNSYTRENDRGDWEDRPSDTLITKILMGTLGCVPAFDRFLKRGIQWLKQTHKSKFGSLRQTIENKGTTFSELVKFAVANKDSLKIENADIEYPVMKCVDMFFWQIGFELDLVDQLKTKSNNLKVKKIASAIIGSSENEGVETIINAINNRWK